MRNATMFGQMEKFKDENFFNQNKYITLNTEYGTFKYEIFAIGVYPADFGYTEISFADDNDFYSFSQKIMKDALFTRDNISSNDKIITLSTCSYEYDDARTAIFAKKVE